MTHTHFSGPPPDELDDACLVCVMVARGTELDALEDQWLALERDGQADRQQWFAWKPDRTLIRPAVIEGVSDILPGMIVPLCWDHLAGLRMPKPASRLANGGGHFPPRGLRR